jgi:hypothetical protein
MLTRCHTRPPSKHILVRHEFPIVFSQSARPRPITGVRLVRGTRPLPHVSEQLTGVFGPAARSRLGAKASGFEQVVFGLWAARSHLPLALKWQSSIRPTCEGIRLEITDMSDGFTQNQAVQPRQAEVLPAILPRNPVERSLPALRLAQSPAFGQPKFWSFVPTVLDESQKLSVAHKARPDLMGVQKDFVSRPLIVEAKACARVSQTVNSFGPSVPSNGCLLARVCLRQVTSIGGIRGIH